VPLEWIRVHDELRALARTHRCVPLAVVRELASKHGLPHPGLGLEQELNAMLAFFHSLNAVLWYSTPSLRNLVIIEPQWLMDAVTSIVRDFKLRDHTDKYPRMATLDQRAIREEGEMWTLLTGGAATLHQRLLDILWSAPDFEPYKVELRDLICRFGLAIPLPTKPDHFLIPALLPPSSISSMPQGWQMAPPAPHMQMRIFFHLSGDLALCANKLVYYERDLTAGFLPISLFHKLCAGAFGWCTPHASGTIEPTLTRQRAYIPFKHTLVTMTYESSNSSILVHIQRNGHEGGKAEGVAAAVADRLRVLILEELAVYSQLQHRALVLAPRDSAAWVDINELPKVRSDSPSFTLNGEQVPIDHLREQLATWLTAECEFTLISADRLREATEAELPIMISLQEMQRTRPDWITRKLISFGGALSGEYTLEILSLSYRWQTADHPDPTGMQLRALQQHLRHHLHIKHVFVDYMCLPQGQDRTPKEKAEFQVTLPNINLLYLGTSVLVIMFDRTYMERFWPQFEAWLSFMSGDETGIVSTPNGQLRCSIECLGDTPVWYKNALTDRWSKRSTAAAHKELSESWVQVTNQSDKEVQLNKVSHLDFMVRHHFRSQKQAAQAPISDNSLATKVAIIKRELAIDGSMPIALVIDQANQVMGIDAVGSLPAQADALIAALGVKC